MTDVLEMNTGMQSKSTSTARMRVLSGIQPTGRFHWGNYFGAIRQYIELQDAGMLTILSLTCTRSQQFATLKDFADLCEMQRLIWLLWGSILSEPRYLFSQMFQRLLSLPGC